jgi:hypothetical protein
MGGQSANARQLRRLPEAPGTTPRSEDDRWEWRALPRSAPLAGQVDEIFLARLERRGVGAGGPFGIHCEPDGPHDNPNDTGGDVLNNLRILLRGERLSPIIVRLNFGIDHRAVTVSVLWLHSRHGLRISAGTSRQGEADGHRRKSLNAHGVPWTPRFLSSDNHGERTRGRHNKRASPNFPNLLHWPKHQAPDLFGRVRGGPEGPARLATMCAT